MLRHSAVGETRTCLPPSRRLPDTFELPPWPLLSFHQLIAGFFLRFPVAVFKRLVFHQVILGISIDNVTFELDGGWCQGTVDICPTLDCFVFQCLLDNVYDDCACMSAIQSLNKSHEDVLYNKMLGGNLIGDKSSHDTESACLAWQCLFLLVISV